MIIMDCLKKKNNTALPRLTALDSKIPAYAYVLILGMYLLIHSTRGNIDCWDTISTELTRRNTVHQMHSLNYVDDQKNILFSLVFRDSL